MLDDNRCISRKLAAEGNCGVDIQIVVVGHLLTLHGLLSGNTGCTVDCGFLVRVFSVAQGSAVLELDGVGVRELLAHSLQIVGDCRIICCGSGECLGGKL